MIKFLTGISILFCAANTAHAATVADDVSLRTLIAKSVARENANRDMMAAMQVVSEVRKELRIAKLKRKARR